MGGERLVYTMGVLWVILSPSALGAGRGGGFCTAGELRISKGKAKGSSHVIKNTSIRALRSRKYLIICDKTS